MLLAFFCILMICHFCRLLFSKSTSKLWSHFVLLIWIMLSVWCYEKMQLHGWTRTETLVYFVGTTSSYRCLIWSQFVVMFNLNPECFSFTVESNTRLCVALQQFWDSTYQYIICATLLFYLVFKMCAATSIKWWCLGAGSFAFFQKQ